MARTAEAELLTAVAAAERNFSTHNTVGGGCVECGCEVLVRYHYDDGTGVPQAPFEMTDAKQNVYHGTTDENGLFHAKNIACGNFDILFDEGEDEFTTTDTIANNPVLQANPHYAAIAAEYFTLYEYLHQKDLVSQSSGSLFDRGQADISHDIARIGSRRVSTADEPAIRRFRELARQIERDNGALEAAIIKTHHQLAGEVSDNSLVIMMVAELILGCIPVVAQAMDVKDCAIWLYDGATGAEGADFSDPLYLGLGVLNVIGFVPGAGDAIKHSLRPIVKFMRKVGDMAGDSGKAIRAIRKLSNGNLIRYLRKRSGQIQGYANQAARVASNLVTGIVALVRKAKRWLPGDITRILDQITNTLRRLEGWIRDSVARLKQWIDDFISKIFTRKSGTASKPQTNPKAKETNAGAYRDKEGRTHQSDQAAKKHQSGDDPKLCCNKVGNPVNVTTGQVSEHRTDLHIPTTPPLTIRRSYHPEHHGGLLGDHWCSNLDTCLAVENDGYHYHAEDHAITHYYDPDPGEHSRNLNNPGIRLARTRQGALYLLHQDGTRHYYGYALGRRLHLSAIEDRNGNRITLERRPSDGFPHTLQHSNGQQLHFSGGRSTDELTLRITRIRHTANQRTRTRLHYHYNDQHRLQQVDGDITHVGSHYEYNPQGQITYRADALRQTWTRYHYNDQGKVSHQHSAGNHYNGRFDYAPGHTRYHQPGGGEIDYYYDTQRRITAIENCRGARTEHHWEHHNLIRTTDPLGRDTTTTYDDWGEPTCIDHPDGRTEQIARDDHGRPIRYTDPLDHTWHYRYDRRGNLTRIIDPLGHSEHHHYNALGQLTASRSPGGGKQRRRYDPHGYLQTHQTADGHIHHYRHDALGRLTHYRDPAGHRQHWHYTDRHTQPTEYTDAAGHTTHTPHNQLGQPESYTDPNGHTTRYTWGPYGKQHSVTDPLGQTTRYQYGPHARLHTITRPNGDTWQHTYDTAGNLIAEQDYSGATTRHDYDLADRRIRTQHPDHSQTHYTYDDGDRLLETAQHSPDGTITRTHYTYDAAGQLISARNADTTIHYTRDPLGRIQQEEHPDHSLQHQYNADGQRIALNSEHYHSTWHYNPAQQLIRQQHNDQAPLHHTYDPNGQETSRTSPAGYGQHNQYDPRGQLRQQRAGIRLPDQPDLHPHAPNLERHYDYDPAGNLQRQTDRYWGRTEYQHDPNDQITDAHRTYHQQHHHSQYHYNSNQDISRSQHKDPYAQTPTTTHHHYQRGGRIHQRGDTRYEYDAKGRLNRKTEHANSQNPKTWIYHWDGDDQLRQLNTPRGDTWAYTYDPFGRRIRKQSDNTQRPTTIHYRWDGNQTIQEIPTHPDGTPDWHKATHNHHNNAGDIVAQTHNGTQYYLNTDPNGLPRALLDETGTIHWRARYDLWGKQQAARHEQPQPAGQPKLNCNLRFHGQHYDAESGLHYNRYRYYDPDTAQYLSPDPIGLTGGLRVQGYVHNPNTWIDPLGLSCKCNATKSRGYDRPEIETKSGTSVKQKDAVDKWDEFLEPDQTNIDPRDGLPDPDRIWSADGKRSIRFGEHEMNSKPNKLHYHQETWYDDKVENVLQRIPK